MDNIDMLEEINLKIEFIVSLCIL